MINLEIFLLGLLIVSTFTSLVTEGVKKILSEHNVTYYANTLVAIVSVVLSVFIAIGYMILTGVTFNTNVLVVIIAMIILSWLCAMVGYDKVIQALYQIKNPTKEG